MYWNCHIKRIHLVSGYKSPYHLSSNYNKTKSYSPSVSATTHKTLLDPGSDSETDGSLPISNMSVCESTQTLTETKG